MNKSMTTRLDKLESATEGGALAIVWIDPHRTDEAQAQAVRLKAEGRRVVLISWMNGDEGDG